MSEIKIKKGEAKNILFTYTSSGVAQDVSSNTFYFVVKEHCESVAIIEKNDIDFDKTNAANGVVSCNLSVTDTDIEEKTYEAEITMIATVDTDVDKSENITFIVSRSIT